MSSAESALVSRLTAELHELEQAVARAETLPGKAREQEDPEHLDGAVLSLHGFCAGAERIRSEIARDIDWS